MIVAVVAVTSCATSYQPSGAMGGFSDVQLAPDLFKIRFGGNAYTSPERAQDFAMLRAAEITLQNGCGYFAIVDENDYTTTQAITTPGVVSTNAYATAQTNGNVYLNPYGGTYSGTTTGNVNATTTYTPPQTTVLHRPRSGLLIRIFQTKPDGIFTYDAAFLQQSLKQSYGIK